MTDQLTIALIGDVMLGRLVNKYLKSAKSEYPWGNTLSVLKQADVRICNLECVISDKGRPWVATPKVFHFRSDAKNIDVLKAAEIDAVSLANNHTLDYEYEALMDMLGLLDKSRIAHAGAGQDRYHASMPAVVKKDKSTIGLVSFTDNEPGWQATSNRPGIFYIPVDINNKKAKVLFELTKRFKKHVDYLIVAAHWGGNWGYEPPLTHSIFAKALIDNGADVIFGHSAHVFRGIEIYRGQPIIYSAGDFIDDYAVDEIERNDESFIFKIEINKHQIQRMRLYPTIIADFQARLAKESRGKSIAAKMQSLCQKLGTQAKWLEDDNCLIIECRKYYPQAENELSN
jgi:poly-gamma-glutamate synthesis protein (capsule biosynthesis protein)